MPSPNNLQYKDLKDIQSLARTFQQNLSNKVFSFYYLENKYFNSIEVEFHPAKFLHLVGITLKDNANYRMQNGLKTTPLNVYNTLLFYNRPPIWLLQHIEISHNVSYRDPTKYSNYDDFIEKKRVSKKLFKEIPSVNNLLSINKVGCEHFLNLPNSNINLGITTNAYKAGSFSPRSNYICEPNSLLSNDKWKEILFCGIKNNNSKTKIINFTQDIDLSILNNFKAFIKITNTNVYFSKSIKNSIEQKAIQNANIQKANKTKTKIKCYIKNIKKKNPAKAEFYKQVFKLDDNMSFKTFKTYASKLWTQEIKRLNNINSQYKQVNFEKYTQRLCDMYGIGVWSNTDINILPIQKELDELYDIATDKVMELDTNNNISLFIVDTSSVPYKFMASSGADIFYETIIESSTSIKSNSVNKTRIKNSIHPTKSKSKPPQLKSQDIGK